ncbi:MAG TPA: nuclear transport factor 2 family protein [Geminicoccaceae bacterium]|nr:nuclear transport factor 2 family protein [Geminicoccaceae bacterium]
MAATTLERTDEAEIRGLIEDWAEAARAWDIDRIMAAYTPDILAFDAIARLQFKGAQAYREHWQACMAMCPGLMIFEIHGLEIEAVDDIAFGHYLVRCGTVGDDGREDAGFMRATFCCRRTGKMWKIAHEHFSAPFDPASGEALLKLAP